MAAGNRRTLAYVRAGRFGIFPSSPAMKTLKNTGGGGLVLERDVLQTGDWRADRAVTEARSGVNKVTMQVPFNLADQAYDDMLEAALFGRFLPATGAQPVTLAVSVTVGSGTGVYTRASGSFLTDGFAVDDFVILSGFVQNANNGVFRITALSATVMTVENPASVTETKASGSVFDRWGGLPVQMGATTIAVATGSPATYTRSAGSFITDGVQVGDWVTFSGFTNAGNNGTFKVTAVTATVLSVTNTGAVTEAAAGNRAYKSERKVLKDGVYPVHFSVEEQQSDAGTYKRASGLMVNQLSLSVKPNAAVTGSLDLIGAVFDGVGTASSAGSVAAAPSTYTMDSFTGSVTEGGTALAIAAGIDFTVTNGIGPKYALFQKNAFQMDPDDCVVTGTLAAFFTDLALTNKFLGETESALVFVLTDLSGVSYRFTFPRVKYTGARANVSKADVMTDLPFAALKDAVSGCHIMIERFAA